MSNVKISLRKSRDTVEGAKSWWLINGYLKTGRTPLMIGGEPGSTPHTGASSGFSNIPADHKTFVCFFVKNGLECMRMYGNVETFADMASSGIDNFLGFGVVSFGDDEYLDVGLVDAPLPTA